MEVEPAFREIRLDKPPLSTPLTSFAPPEPLVVVDSRVWLGHGLPRHRPPVRRRSMDLHGPTREPRVDLAQRALKLGRRVRSRRRRTRRLAPLDRRARLDRTISSVRRESQGPTRPRRRRLVTGFESIRSPPPRRDPRGRLHLQPCPVGSARARDPPQRPQGHGRRRRERTEGE